MSTKATLENVNALVEQVRELVEQVREAYGLPQETPRRAAERIPFPTPAPKPKRPATIRRATLPQNGRSSKGKG